MTWKNGYKVLYRAPDGTLWSAIIKRLGIQYLPNKLTVPCFGDGPLTLFKTRSQAKKFLSDYCINIAFPIEHEYCIYNCDYTPYPACWRQIAASYIRKIIGRTHGGVYMWYKDRDPIADQYDYVVFCGELIPGTILARSIKLIKEVEIV